ncbi:hypothetical protein SPRG_10653 [Saprolegnia parasitica CBS 223.65]|uniref:RNA helicase n=1 Tax=Saprolegnia parasitica (strain CBS 223.65) TaxID=695850 RepID=A0A067CAV9_SAPPC|nr:hypothetical protein SPRG_10653 [Saprolegnia parasitica CBS 223.65]KDO23957.1 hypothetical protein SPRG_10653 [Saprolegnia parasitica CBS 223.65]|eukprot:XP_012205279.1 hypothetical protein SPRG_10653 [Saprolegnia parasitica CBS 223.65]
MGDSSKKDRPRESSSRKSSRRSRSRDDRHKRSSRKRSRSHDRGREKKERRRSRSRTRDRSRDRSRSRDKSHRDKKRKTSHSRSPEPPRKKKDVAEKRDADVAKPLAEKTSPAREPTKGPTSFGGLALKDKKKPARVEHKSTKEDKAALEEAEKEKRLERLRLWREQQQQLQKNEEAEPKTMAPSVVPAPSVVNTGFLVEDDDEVKQVHIWPMDEKEEKELEDDKAKMHQETKIDPLDAFMAELTNDSIEQQSLSLHGAPKVISLEDIMSTSGPRLDFYGSFLPTESNTVKPTTEGPMEPLVETDAERDAREKRELEEFMRAIKTKREQEEKAMTTGVLLKADDDEPPAEIKKTETGRIYQGTEEDAIGEEMEDEDTRTALEILQEQQKRKDIKPVDHAQVDYIAFRKKFYIEPQEIANLSQDEVNDVLKDLEIKIRGKNCPRPILKWTQAGLSGRLLKLITRQTYEAPFAIQCQALPAIMSGRDVIGIAKTGSGKTLAFLLPMFRHILDQPPLADGEGPIGLIMAPARELVQQIYLESKKFTKDLGLRSTAVYGGSSVSEQIANLKRGSDIVICTPGRMIDILCMSAGKMVSLKRVTYVVLDEADRMFDMGFEPQITKIMMNIRTDRQTLLFSATFPRAVETLARKVLKKPIEITVGARSTASGDITQYAEVREEHDKFMRLLQLLGVWYEKGNVLVFVNTQQACDTVFQDLMKAGYPALSLHGGKDQVDRDYTVDDFKRKVRTLMVATSVAGRGLDVKDLVLVINYHCPNHIEDYVHRVGRTGRAGRKGTAYTFISPQEDEYAPDLVKALETAKQAVPPELIALADGFKEKVKNGLARYHGSGFGGSGFTFDATEKSEAQRAADAQRRHYEIDQGMIDATDNDGRDDDDDESSAKAQAAGSNDDASALSTRTATGIDKARLVIERLQAIKEGTLSLKETTHFHEELEINDYPQQARYKVVQKEASDIVADMTGASVICRGTYVPAGRKPQLGERKLYLSITGSSRHAVQQAKAELQRILDEKTLEVGLSDNKYGKYTI